MAPPLLSPATRAAHRAARRMRGAALNPSGGGEPYLLPRPPAARRRGVPLGRRRRPAAWSGRHRVGRRPLRKRRVALTGPRTRVAQASAAVVDHRAWPRSRSGWERAGATFRSVTGRGHGAHSNESRLEPAGQTFLCAIRPKLTPVAARPSPPPVRYRGLSAVVHRLRPPAGTAVQRCDMTRLSRPRMRAPVASSRTTRRRGRAAALRGPRAVDHRAGHR